MRKALHALRGVAGQLAQDGGGRARQACHLRGVLHASARGETQGLQLELPGGILSALGLQKLLGLVDAQIPVVEHALGATEQEDPKLDGAVRVQQVHVWIQHLSIWAAERLELVHKVRSECRDVLRYAGLDLAQLLAAHAHALFLELREALAQVPDVHLEEREHGAARVVLNAALRPLGLPLQQVHRDLPVPQPVLRMILNGPLVHGRGPSLVAELPPKLLEQPVRQHSVVRAVVRKGREAVGGIVGLQTRRRVHPKQLAELVHALVDQVEVHNEILETVSGRPPRLRSFLRGFLFVLKFRLCMQHAYQQVLSALTSRHRVQVACAGKELGVHDLPAQLHGCTEGGG
mmetsp:Transcript_40939/g.131674  ORF Transcript_40939/g.131674 Transcript_40939/m.131674 type:complete len:347 (-) Transcript_40939:772-1812(-)